MFSKTNFNLMTLKSDGVIKGKNYNIRIRTMFGLFLIRMSCNCDQDDIAASSYQQEWLFSYYESLAIRIIVITRVRCG